MIGLPPGKTHSQHGQLAGCAGGAVVCGLNQEDAVC
jgi:hypothetical protein